MIAHSFLSLNSILLCECAAVYSIHLLVKDISGASIFLVIINKVAINICIEIFVWTLFYYFFTFLFLSKTFNLKKFSSYFIVFNFQYNWST